MTTTTAFEMSTTSNTYNNTYNNTYSNSTKPFITSAAATDSYPMSPRSPRSPTPSDRSSLSSASSGSASSSSADCIEKLFGDRIEHELVAHVDAGYIERKYGAAVRTLGAGTGGSVALHRSPADGALVAVKTFAFPAAASFERRMQHVAAEARVALAMAQPNIVRTFEYVCVMRKTECAEFYSVMEYCVSDLFEYVQRRPLSPQAVGSVFVQLVAGLHHMHTVHATAHRDIKLDNICVSPDGAVKIVDFGCATSSSATAATGACGSEPYMPPEVAASPAVAYDAFKMDIWSLGVVLLALISGHFPWEAPRTSDENFAMYVQHGERLLDHWLGGASGGKLHPAAPLVKRMLALDPAARPSISDVIADSWFRSLIANMRG